MLPEQIIDKNYRPGIHLSMDPIIEAIYEFASDAFYAGREDFVHKGMRWHGERKYDSFEDFVDELKTKINDAEGNRTVAT